MNTRAEKFPLKNPTEAKLAELTEKHGDLRGLRLSGTKVFFIWPAEYSWHVEMAERLEEDGEIRRGTRLDRIVISKAEDAWFLYRDDP